MTHLTIRADGGPEIGFGHLVRSSAIAEVALENDDHVTVATATPDPARDVFPDGTDIRALPNRHDPDQFCSWIDNSSVDTVFVDAYPVDTDYQRAIRKHTPLVVHQDDARHTICADALVNGNLYATDLEYEFVGDNPQQYLGPDYALLRKEVREAAQCDPPWRNEPERALITMGGSDIASLTPSVVRAFDGFDLKLDAIVGPGFSASQEREITRAGGEISADVQVLRDPGELVERMFQADFAVSTASSTTYELLALGTPMISLPVAENQEPIAEVLRDRSIATVVNRDPHITELNTVIVEYVESSSPRQERQQKGRELVDGQGSNRVYRSLKRLT